jgi:hypothetical protein
VHASAEMPGTTGNGQSTPSDGKGVGFESWNLALIVAVVTGVFVALFVVYAALKVPRLGLRCDRPKDGTGSTACTSVGEGGTTTVSAPFVRVIPPWVERFAWWVASAALVTFVLVLLIPSLLWWLELRRDLKPMRLAPANWLVPILLTVFVTWLLLQPVFGGDFDARLILLATPTLISWAAAIPAMAALLDVHATARTSAGARRASFGRSTCV